MSVVYVMERKKSEKRIKELTEFLIDLDSMADKLYNKLEYRGVWETLMKLEDVRITYYIEYHEHNEFLKENK
jgi:hypothetical protein